jgi:TRAP-type C4-dicarboxylate transport system substrate-binding protein
MSRALACLLLLASVARAQTVLRFATVAPDGTAWAHELRAFSRDVERRTEQRVKVKWYWGSIAGGDLEVADRIRSGQLDGAGSGGPLCTEVMPSLRITQIPGLFQSAAEAAYAINQLSGTLTAEAQKAGFVLSFTAQLGASVVFARHPISSFAELRRTPIWLWDGEQVLMAMYRDMGLKLVPAPVDRAARDFDAGRTDAFWAIPAAALASKNSARNRSVGVITFTPWC